MININGFFTNAQSMQELIGMSSEVTPVNALETRLDIDGLLLTAVNLGGSFRIRVDYSPLNRKGWNRLVDVFNPCGLMEDEAGLID